MDANVSGRHLATKLGYYSLVHPFPLMKVHHVYHKKDALWSFTVVGRPPQEDTSFGALIHEISGSAIPQEIHGLKEVNAVDAAGVHPLLFAIGSERYTPYLKERKPQEILTISNHILGKNQLSLAKYLFIAAIEDNENLDTHDISHFLSHVLERIDWKRDVHFHTNTTIDTLDYSGDGLNAGSKVVFAAAGEKKRTLLKALPSDFKLEEIHGLASPGILVVQLDSYLSQQQGKKEIATLKEHLKACDLSSLPLVVVCDDAKFTSENINNLVWVAFTRSNPAADIDGVGDFTENKHWGCNGSLIIDARKKPHHAPELIKDLELERKVDKMGEKGGALYGII
ncbi:MAG: hypothetical protein EOO42_23450 [Flavobacteriales bacterium]|nr:MAG: hypothetical protein EOO42_23450 [Flavobacteriales bacterium]